MQRHEILRRLEKIKEMIENDQRHGAIISLKVLSGILQEEVIEEDS